jgi:hypothetical protein
MTTAQPPATRTWLDRTLVGVLTLAALLAALGAATTATDTVSVAIGIILVIFFGWLAARILGWVAHLRRPKVRHVAGWAPLPERTPVDQ